MRLFWQVSLCCLLAGGAGTIFAQRGGGFGGGGHGGMGGGSFGGGVYKGGGGFMPGGTPGGGFGGGTFTGGAFPGGFGFHAPFGVFNLGGNINQPGHIQAVGFPFGFHDGHEFGDRFGFNNGFYGYGGYGFWPEMGYPSYLPNYAYSSYYPGYDYPYTVSGYSSYQTSPNVTVLYPTQSTVPPLSAERAHPVMKEYDQNGQEIRPGGSPLYLIAFKDHTITAATTYRVEGDTLHYTTQQNENKDASLDTVDRALSLTLNRQRQVPFDLPPQ